MNAANANDGTTRPSVLVVDDTPENITLMAGLLRDLYRVKVATSGEKALRIAAEDPPPDLILLDIMMPHMDGYEVCRRIKADERTRGIPVIFLTAKATVEDERIGLELGAVDYITKPISPPIVLARIRTHLDLKAAADFLRNKNAILEVEVARRTREIAAIQDVTVTALASLAETRDVDTGNHILRTQHYVKALAEELSGHPRFEAFLTPSNRELLFKTAQLHDIGKVGIPDRILLKPGRLTPEEFEVMKTHAVLGHDAIEHAEQRLGLNVEFLEMAKEIALSHHERWDGAGYPQGLVGERIPITARIMALADVYDALISRRVYKEPTSHEDAVAEIERGRGSQFDPDMTDAFLRINPRFREIAQRFADTERSLRQKRDHIEATVMGRSGQAPAGLPVE